MLFRSVHLHVPAGAIPKDGPSAGVTITAALASLYTGRRVRPDTSMTGEITLSGLVFPVGGIKEKVLAAHRAGIRRIILPGRNEADLEDIPEDVRKELNLKLVTRISEVVDAALENVVANPPPPVPAGTPGPKGEPCGRPRLTGQCTLAHLGPQADQVPMGRSFRREGHIVRSNDRARLPLFCSARVSMENAA